MLGQEKKCGFHERLVPDGLPWYHRQMYFNHIARYSFATNYVRGMRVLDIACGSGYGSLVLAGAGARKVYGVDISTKAIKYAKKRYPHRLIKYRVGDVRKIPIRSNSVDVVVSFETLEHIREHALFLKEIERVLKNDGVVIISTPNILFGDKDANPFHLRELSLTEFESLLKRHFSEIKMWGQRPMYESYLKLINKITESIRPGMIRWFIDSALKYIFRSNKIKPLSEFKKGFVPYVFLAVAKNVISPSGFGRELSRTVE